MKDTTAARKWQKLRLLLEEKENFKEVYEQIDELTLELAENGRVAKEFRDKSQIHITDNFGEKNVQFRPAKFVRFEAKIVPPDKG